MFGGLGGGGGGELVWWGLAERRFEAGLLMLVYPACSIPHAATGG